MRRIGIMVLIMASVGWGQQVTTAYRITVPTEGKVKEGEMVAFFTCGGNAYASIYRDYDLTTPLANPMIPDHGHVEAYIPVNDRVYAAVWDHGKKQELSDCRGAKWMAGAMKELGFNPPSADKGELVGPPCKTPCSVTLPAPLKCGKYQHLVSSGENTCYIDTRTGKCKDIPDRCEDDLHTVTEKEWQALLYDRQKSMEVEEKLLESISELKREIEFLRARKP